MATVVVSGAIANRYLRGGAVWTRLSYALGFRRLGFEVYFVEQIDPGHCVDARGVACAFEESANLAYFRDVTSRFGLAGASALLCGQGEQVDGVSLDVLIDIADAADLLVNISGHLRDARLLRRFRRKVYVDQDPGFTQLWHAAGNSGAALDGHQHYFSVGENIGTRACPIPTGSIRWRPTRQPVVLAEWPLRDEGALDRFTTVASWRGAYGRVAHEGHVFGLKAHEFRRFAALPERAAQRFEIALDIDPADGSDLCLLRDHAWNVVDPKIVAADPLTFRRYVQQSGAEFSVAQGLYVESHCGWFSDRTARYLASGKPVLVQDTGFSGTFPVGEGLVAFRTLEEAVAGAERIAKAYGGHCRAAREIAETYFDSDKVLGRMVEEIGVSP